MGKIKWFLGEFFVVVAGVLVAFILNSWWLNIRDGQKEKDYLVKIHNDIAATIENVTEAEEEQRGTLHAASFMLKAAYSTESFPDSVLNIHTLGAMSFAPSSQVSATLTTLVTTGDLQLISNDSLRMAMGELASALESYKTSMDHMAFEWLIPCIERFADASNVADMRYTLFNDELLTRIASDTLSGFTHPATLQRPDKPNWKLLFESKLYKAELVKLQIAQANLWRLHKSFLEDLQKNQTMIEKEIQSKGIRKITREGSLEGQH